MSGDMCTSLGNGFTNYMLLSYLMYSKGVGSDQFRCLVEGDDCIMGSNVELTPGDYEALGFTIKIERVDDPCRASFCGLICTENGVNVRDPVRFFEKFGWTHSCLQAGPKVMMQLLKAKAMSALCECPDCPLVSAVAWEAYLLCGSLIPRFDPTDWQVGLLDIEGTVFKPPEPNHDIRVLFEEEFGVAVEQQLFLEQKIREHDLLPLYTALDFHPDIHDYSGRFVEVEA
jgi:hypothetical protein